MTRLTQTVKCAGCAAKIPPHFLHQALSNIEWPRNSAVLQAMEGSEDCGVYQINPEEALLHTTDFFPPVVDDPYMYGQIAAANALSDIYAMGGKALNALNLVCYPEDLGPKILNLILKGGADKAREADCPILGGHSVGSSEMKYGLAVTGICKIKDIKYNYGALAGDLLILTKPLGTGILNTAIKRGQLKASTIEALLESMRSLNRHASEIIHNFRVHAVTDITGFGFLGHATEMSRRSKVPFLIESTQLPLLPETREAIEQGHITRGDKNNRLYAAEFAEFAPSLEPFMQNILFDPQTSGGLLIAVAAEDAPNLLKELRMKAPAAAIVGKVLEDTKSSVIHIR